MIQFSAETPSRGRSRRRVGEPATAAEAPMPNTPILVDDDEDDMAFSSARAYATAQARNKARVDAHRSTRAAPDLAVAVEASLEEANRARGSAMEDNTLGIRLDPLEWRLGPGGGNVGTVEFSFQNQGIVTGRPARSTIDLTTASPTSFATPTLFRSAPSNEDCVVLHEYTKNPRKRKPVPEEPVLVVREVAPEPAPAPPPPPPPPPAEEYRFKCAICMEDMKEETSTICGHIFCGACIKGAVQAQKKCPTCRKKLNMKNIHRIYL